MYETPNCSHVLTKLTQAHAQGHLRGATRSRQDRRGFFLGRSAAPRSFLYVPSVEKKFTVKRLGSLAPGSLSSGMSERTLRPGRNSVCLPARAGGLDYLVYYDFLFKIQKVARLKSARGHGLQIVDVIG